MIPTLRVFAAIAMLFNALIIFRVVDDWLGILPAILSMAFFPISVIVMPIAMLFFSSAAAAPLSLWPAIAVVGLLEWFARKSGGSLSIR